MLPFLAAARLDFRPDLSDVCLSTVSKDPVSRQDDITRERRCIMTTKRQRKKVARQLPPVGTTLTARHKGQPHTAVIVEAKDRPAGRAVEYGDQLFASLSAAAKAVTGHSTNGWVFWRPAEGNKE
jgi:hypothetical protein